MSTIQGQRPPQGSAHQRTSPAIAQSKPESPRKGLDCYISATCLIEPTTPEAALVDQVQQLCLEECIRYFRQVQVRSYQELSPKAISQIHPPERCWLVYLSVSQDERGGAAEEIQGIVSQWDGALHLLLR